MNKYQLKRGLLITSLLVLQSCASITTGKHQNLSIDTFGTQGATCNLTNDKGTWLLPNTPGSITVQRSYNDLNIHCKKDGYESGILSVQSSTKTIAFGNILFGGIIGGAVDAGSGAAYDYPGMITIPMKQLASNKK